MDEQTTSEPSEISLDEFKQKIVEVWDDLQDRDLQGARDSLDDLSESVQEATGEAANQVRDKIQDLADRFDFDIAS